MTQTDINNKLWEACDVFRGMIDPENYKDLILVMLFLKYISDTWTEQYNKFLEETGDEKKALTKMRSADFTIPKESHFSYIYTKRNEATIGKIIDKALKDLELANPETLTDILTRHSFNSEQLGDEQEKVRRLSLLMVSFNALDLKLSVIGRNDIIGESYMFLLDKFASDAGKKAGEFFTPPHVSDLVAQLSGAKKGDAICDPTCGSGSLLLKTAHYADNNPNPKLRDYELAGMDVNGNTYALAKMNMLIHGEGENARIEWCNSLTAPRLVENGKLLQYDTVVSNPPFSLDKWASYENQGGRQVLSDPYSVYYRGTPPNSKGDWAFLSLMLAMAKEKSGRVAVVVPHGVLFRSSSEGKIRQAVIEENLLDAVIGLAPNLFQTTGIPVAIIIFDKGRKAGDKVCFIDASKEFHAKKNQNTLSTENINKIVNTYKNKQETDKFSCMVSLEEIAENDYNLNIPRYVDTFEASEKIDLIEVSKEIKEIESELSQLRKELDTLTEGLR